MASSFVATFLCLCGGEGVLSVSSQHNLKVPDTVCGLVLR